jgi:hypothetical protein
MVDRDALLAMSRAERRQLLAWIHEIDDKHFVLTRSMRARRRFGMLLCTGASLFMTVWITVLLLTLPNRYQTTDWRVTWVGLDVAELILLVSLTWAAWRTRQLVVPLMVATSTVLACDAWFDVTLSARGDRVISILTAACVELPIATFLLTRARWIIMHTVASLSERLGMTRVPRRLRQIPLFGDIDDSFDPATARVE